MHARQHAGVRCGCEGCVWLKYGGHGTIWVCRTPWWSSSWVGVVSELRQGFGERRFSPGIRKGSRRAAGPLRG